MRNSWAALGLAAAIGCAAPPAAAPSPEAAALPAVQRPGPLPIPGDVAALGDSATDAEMRNVRFRIDPLLALDVRHLRGRMRPRRAGRPIDFDDKRSFELALAEADVVMDTTSLARLLNGYVFGYPGAPLTRLHVATRDTLLEIRGLVHEGATLPFRLRGVVRRTADGRIRVHPVDLDLAGADIDWLLHALGVYLDQVIATGRSPGLEIRGDDLLLDPNRVLPPPEIHGPLVAARVVRGGLALRFSDPALAARLGPASTAGGDRGGNFMAFRGGTLKFGKLYMVHADVELVDSVPATPFDFFLDQYHRQLVAGHSETRADYGLRVVMPDYGALVRTAARGGGGSGAEAPARRRKP